MFSVIRVITFSELDDFKNLLEQSRKGQETSPFPVCLEESELVSSLALVWCSCRCQRAMGGALIRQS